MIKLLIGGKGSGKTKTLIALTNKAAEETKGSVVCIEKGDILTHEITYKVRLIDTNDYNICNANSFYGFISGILASNSDITDIFVDSTLKICDHSIESFESVLKDLDNIAKDINLVMSVSVPVEECPDALKAYVD